MHPLRVSARRVRIHGLRGPHSLEVGVYRRVALAPFDVSELIMEGGAISRRRTRKRRFIAYFMRPEERVLCDGARFLRAGVDVATFADLTESQMFGLHYIGRYGYPLFSVSRFFHELGVDPFEAPPLDVSDAYAVTQLAIWHVLEPNSTEPELVTVSELFSRTQDGFSDHEIASRTHPEKSCRINQAVEAFCRRIAEESALPLQRPLLRIVTLGKTRRLRLPKGGLAVGPFVILGFEAVAMTVHVSLARRGRGEQIVNAAGHPTNSVCPEERFFLRLRRTSRRSPVVVARLIRPMGLVPFICTDRGVNREVQDTDIEKPLILVVIGMAREIITARRLVRLRRSSR